MTWTKLSDDFGDDCWELSDAAYRLHVEGLLWSNRKLLDLRIPKSDMRRGWAKHPEAVGELLSVGWWKSEGDHYLIVHHAVYQRSRAAVLAQQGANQQNGRKGGRPPALPRERAPSKPGKKPSTEIDSLTESESEWVSGEDGPTAQETHSLTESKSESKSEMPTERDRTGQGLDKGIHETNGETKFTPTPEQLARIEANVRRGYES